MKGLDGAMKRAGGLLKLASVLGVHPRTVRKWRMAGAMPVVQARRVERLYGVVIQNNGLETGGVGILELAREAGWDMGELETVLGVSRPAVRRWIKDGYVPPKQAERILELVDKGRITR